MRRKKTPYEALDVEKSASKETIKRAYRRKAKELHPDKGGNREEFVEIAKAFKLLTDSERRKRYDETGNDSDESASTIDSKVREIVADVFEQVLMEACSDKDANKVDTFDVMAEVRRLLNARRETEYENREKLVKALAKIHRAKKRLKSKGESKFLLNYFEKPIVNLTEGIRDCEAKMEVLNSAIVLTNDYEYEVDTALRGFKDYRRNEWFDVGEGFINSANWLRPPVSVINKEVK